MTMRTRLDKCEFVATQNSLTFDGFKRILRKSLEEAGHLSSSASSPASIESSSSIVVGSKLLVLQAPYKQFFWDPGLAHYQSNSK